MAGTLFWFELLVPLILAISVMDDIPIVRSHNNDIADDQRYYIIERESQRTRQTRLFFAGSCIYLGICNIPIVVWLNYLGKGDTSWSGPFSDSESSIPPEKAGNRLTLAYVFVFCIYGTSVFLMDKARKEDWPYLIFPIVTFLVGIASELLKIISRWIRFWQFSVNIWPAEYAALWVLVWYNEFFAFLAGIVYTYQLLSYFR